MNNSQSTDGTLSAQPTPGVSSGISAPGAAASEILEEPSGLFSRVLSSITDFFYVFDLEGRFTFANKPLLELWGLTLEQVVGKDFFQLKYPVEVAAKLQRQIQLVIETKNRVFDETAYTSPTGDSGFYQYIFSPVIGIDGSVEAVAGSTRDITEQRRATEATQRRERQFRFLSELGERTRDLLNPQEVMIAVAQALGEHLQASRCAYADVEADSEHFTIQHDYCDNCPTTVGSYQLSLFGARAAADQRSGRTLVICDVEKELQRDDGAAAFLAIGVQAVICCPLVRQGRLVAMMAVHQNTPRRWSAEEIGLVEAVVERSWAYIERARGQRAVRQSEDYLRLVVDSSAGGFYGVDSQGACTICNAAFLRMLKFDRADQVIGRQLHELIHHSHADGSFYPRAQCPIYRAASTGEPAHVDNELFFRTDGTSFPVEYWSYPILRDGEVKGAVTTFNDVTEKRIFADERERLLNAERVARAEAEAANRAKDKFLAVLSHELRTPLSPVVLALPALETDADLPEKFRDDLAMIRRNIELEVKLIDDLLDLSRVTAGKLRLMIQPVSVHELLQHVLRNNLNEAVEKNIAIERDFAARHDRVIADPARLQQVFWNLLLNAVKFTPRDGRIILRTSNSAENCELKLEVIDNGVGIEPEVLPRIFEAFEQGNTRTTRQFGGLGLGLAIVKAVIEMHGGRITASSAGHNKGSQFCLCLATSEKRQNDRPAQPPPDAAAKVAAPPRVLLVEDHPDTAFVLAKLLTLAGFAVQAANSVASALQFAAAQPFDIVVSDIGLPDATGYELMAQLRDQYKIKGIALSGYGMEEDMRKSREAGFVDHVVKPVDVAQLQAIILRVVSEQADSVKV